MGDCPKRMLACGNGPTEQVPINHPASHTNGGLFVLTPCWWSPVSISMPRIEPRRPQLDRLTASFAPKVSWSSKSLESLPFKLCGKQHRSADIPGLLFRWRRWDPGGQKPVAEGMVRCQHREYDMEQEATRGSWHPYSKDATRGSWHPYSKDATKGSWHPY